MKQIFLLFLFLVSTVTSHSTFAAVENQCAEVFLSKTETVQDQMKSMIQQIESSENDAVRSRLGGDLLGRWIVKQSQESPLLFYELISLSVRSNSRLSQEHYVSLFDQLIKSIDHSRTFFKVVEVFLQENRLSIPQRAAVTKRLYEASQDYDVVSVEQKRLYKALIAAKTAYEVGSGSWTKQQARAAAEASFRTYLKSANFEFDSVPHARHAGQSLAQMLRTRANTDAETDVVKSTYARLLYVALAEISVRRYALIFFNSLLDQHAEATFTKLSASDQKLIRAGMKIAAKENNIAFDW